MLEVAESKAVKMTQLSLTWFVFEEDKEEEVCINEGAKTPHMFLFLLGWDEKVFIIQAIPCILMGDFLSTTARDHQNPLPPPQKKQQVW